MISLLSGKAARLAIIPILLFIGVGTAGCSFCVGSGCNNGQIEFGSSFKQDSEGGDISIVGKTDTFTIGQPFAMVAHLSDNAGTKTLTLEVARGGSKHSFPYTVSSADSNVLAQKFSSSDLSTLGLTTAGSYTLRILHGSNELAKGSLTEK